jgi:hypothetical protein
MDLFTTEIFTQGVLPFLLVFVLVFAVLQKTKILGDGKKQIDALVALAVALILIGTKTPRDYIVQMMPWLAVALIVLLVFFLIYGFADSDKEKGLVMEKWMKNSLLWIAIGFVALLVFTITGQWEKVNGWIQSGLIGNALIVVAIGIALWVALRKEDSSGK